ncbi:hypothetical protein GCM10010305_02550 [Streptomyces termitum]|uniref:Uncharacterized protein n=1 Tax=Streptomyces termitum TaxID=67368 RepID=A0A918W2B7_9ACTN|nr:hypothetical protein GCM10010305_02550 [Streptomyces termitum]
MGRERTGTGSYALRNTICGLLAGRGTGRGGGRRAAPEGAGGDDPVSAPQNKQARMHDSRVRNGPGGGGHRARRPRGGQFSQATPSPSRSSLRL